MKHADIWKPQMLVLGVLILLWMRPDQPVSQSVAKALYTREEGEDAEPCPVATF